VPNADKPPQAVLVVVALVGLAGIVGGVAAPSGNREWARMVYVMAAIYVFNFPIGTILEFWDT
jgi:hypothetical protein